jgi:predicted ATP-grasp superfamily ATP-dependent carboligase
VSGAGAPDKSYQGNPGRAAKDWPSAVIGGAWRTGVLGMRALYRRGVQASCFDTGTKYEGFRSKYGAGYSCPNPDTDADAWVEFMIKLAGRMNGRPVLIPSSDQYVSAISTHEAALAPYYILSPGLRMQGLLATKETQYQLAADHGMPMPRTQYVHSADDVIAFSRDAVFPCLLKPIHFRQWQAFPDGHPLSHEKIAIANNPEELVNHWKLASAIDPNVLLQEIIEGRDTAKRYYVSVYDRGGRRVANALFRELRCHPVEFGPPTVSEPVVDEETDAICDNFLRSVGYSGICEIELKRDSRDGKMKLIEVNPRLTGGGDAAPHAGVETCWLHYLDMIGQSVTPVRPNGIDFRHIILRSDARAIMPYVRAGLASWGDIARSYRAPRAFFDVDGDDWRYSLETFYRASRSFVGSLIRKK